MFMSIIKALVDTNGPDISGKDVDMPAGSYHVVSNRDINYFRDHPGVFEITRDAVDDGLALTTTDAIGNTVLRVNGAVVPLSNRYLPRVAVAGASNSNRASYANSTNQGFAPHNWLQWLLAMSEHSFEVVSMAGEGGRHISVVDANFAAEVLAYDPDIVILGSDSAANWMYNGAGANNADAALDYVKSIHAQCQLAGARLIVTNLPPNGNLSAGNDADLARTQATMKYNRILSEWAAGKRDVRVVTMDYVDVAAADGRYVTTSVASLTTDAFTHDGTHPHPRMAIHMAQAINAALFDLPSPPWLSQGCNASTLRAHLNPLTVGSLGTLAGGATGVVADNWTLTGAAAGTTVGSKVARTDLGPNAEWQRVVATTANGNVTLAVTGRGVGGFPTGVGPGTPVMVLVEIKLNSAPTNLRGVQLSQAWNGSSILTQGFRIDSAGAFATLADAGNYIPVGETLWLATAVAPVPNTATGPNSMTLTFAKSSAGDMTVSADIGRVVFLPKASLPFVLLAQTVP